MAYITELFKQNNIKNDRLFYLNTNSLLDIASGEFLPGIYKKKHQFHLNGGLAPLNGIIGTEQTYKSSIGLSFLSRVLSIYKDSYGLCYDSEYAIPNEHRIITLSDEIKYGHDIGNRLVLKDKSDYDMDQFFNLLKKMVLEREQHKKDLLVETPFINPKTGKPYLTVIPLVVIIDSLSLMQSAKELTMYNEHDISAKEQNMMFMMDGKAKSQFIKQLPLMAHKGGIHFILTAHITTKVSINPFEKTKKELQFMKFNDTTRGTGKQFSALMNTLLETRSVKVLQDSKKGAYYPLTKNSSNVDLSTVDTVTCRNKNNESGSIVPFISSQKYGIQSSLGNYHYLRDEPSLNLKGAKSKIPLKPDITFNRKQIRKQ